MKINKLILLLFLINTLGVKAKEKPNVLFIMSDDLCTAMSGFGHPQCHTPNLDRLANRGVRFERAYCQYPVCEPSHASIMTGLYPTTNGVMSNGAHFRKKLPNLTTMSQLFIQNGYAVARVSKIYHLGIPANIISGIPKVTDPQSWQTAINIKGPEHNAPGEMEHLSPKMKSKGMVFFKVEADGDDLVHADGLAAQEAIKLMGKNEGTRKWVFSYYLGSKSSEGKTSPRAAIWNKKWKLYEDGRLFDLSADLLEKILLMLPIQNTLKLS